MSDDGVAKLSDVEVLIKELREEKEAKKKKPWVLTPGRAENFEKTRLKRQENIEKRKREKLAREAFEAERKAFYEMAAQKPTSHVVSQAPEMNVSTVTPNVVHSPPVTTPVIPVQPAAAPSAPPAEMEKNLLAPAAEKEVRQVRFVEKPILADETEPVNHEHDHDDGWMTRTQPSSSAMEQEKLKPDPEVEPVVQRIPLQRATNAAACMADWGEAEMSKMATRKRRLENEDRQSFSQAQTYRKGTGAGNHAPFEGDQDYVEPWRQGPPSSGRYTISEEEALQMLAMPKDVALHYLASRVASGRTRVGGRMDENVEVRDNIQEFLSHTRHYSQRHPSQLHNSTNSVRYGEATGDNFVWL